MSFVEAAYIFILEIMPKMATRMSRIYADERGFDIVDNCGSQDRDSDGSGILFWFAKPKKIQRTARAAGIAKNKQFKPQIIRNYD